MLLAYAAPTWSLRGVRTRAPMFVRRGDLVPAQGLAHRNVAAAPTWYGLVRARRSGPARSGHGCFLTMSSALRAPRVCGWVSQVGPVRHRF